MNPTVVDSKFSLTAALEDETKRLLDYLRKRNLSAKDAGIIMSVVIELLVRDDRKFKVLLLRVMAESMDVADILKAEEP